MLLLLIINNISLLLKSINIYFNPSLKLVCLFCLLLVVMVIFVGPNIPLVMFLVPFESSLQGRVYKLYFMVFGPIL